MSLRNPRSLQRSLLLTRKWKSAVSFSSGSLTRTTCVVPAANILKARVPEDKDQNNGELGVPTMPAKGRPEERGQRGGAAEPGSVKKPVADSRRTDCTHLREGRPEVGAALPEGGGPGGARASAAASAQLRARTAHREPRPSAPLQPLPPKSAARAAAAGPVRTCHPVGKHQPHGSRPALLPPRATAVTATPFPYQVSPFRSEVLSSVAMSDRWVSRSAAPPSAIFFH